jgi:hypothetical protein
LGGKVEEGERGGAREGGATDKTKQATDEDVPIFSTDMVFLTYETFDRFFYVPRFSNHHVLKPYY